MHGQSNRWASLLLCCTMCVGLGFVATEANGKKLSPYEAAVNDPRSGAALNRDVARRSHVKITVRAGDRRIHWGPVNNPAADLTAQDTQSETTVVHLNGTNIIAAFNDSGSYTGGGNHFTGFARSGNNGLSWTDGGILPARAGGDAGDPVLTYHSASNSVYFATLGFSIVNTIQIFKSTDSGHTWAAPVNAFP